MGTARTAQPRSRDRRRRAADACTYFIGRFGNYSGESLEAPVEDQVEQVILDVLDTTGQS